MSWRIEQTNPLRLLGELPGGWAQMCLTRPPRDCAPEATLAILAQAHRVLREDGTLWLLAHRHEQSLRHGLLGLGFARRPTPAWASILGHANGTPWCLLLFAKSERCFYDERLFAAPGPPARAVCPGCCSRQARRAQPCGYDHERYRLLVKRCVLAGSALIACGACGAPYTPARPTERHHGIRRPTCAHENPDGRCLVLDPFYDPRTGTAELIAAAGRSFLGITPARTAGERS